MNYCTSCAYYYSFEFFTSKGKTYKTCINCLNSKSKKRATEKKSKLDSDYNDETIVKLILPQALSDYVAELIFNTEKNTGISFKICIDFNDIFSQKEPDLKSIVRLIIDKIEEESMIKLNHSILHEKPNDTTMVEEIKQEIRSNIHMDPIQI
ncbi:9128_t:CDS:2 [Cetraspora pellucida]|uniref:9128_t:CDS:1 n=1 Tax=Cetraspora pellucida TaxID=1433469 RepID=A0A9N8VMP4_9GLOM|nr:9128_t:CDS:2 [Cetraspora pellucida]